MIGISTVGGFFHNFGQLAMASLLAKTTSVMLYCLGLPFLEYLLVLQLALLEIN